MHKEPTKRKTPETKSLEEISGPHAKRVRQKGAVAGAKVTISTTYIFPPELTDAQRRCVHEAVEPFGKHHTTFTSEDGTRRLYAGGDGSGREDLGGAVIRFQHPKGEPVTKAQLKSWVDAMRTKAPHAAAQHVGPPAGPPVGLIPPGQFLVGSSGLSQASGPYMGTCGFFRKSNFYVFLQICRMQPKIHKTVYGYIRSRQRL